MMGNGRPGSSHTTIVLLRMLSPLFVILSERIAKIASIKMTNESEDADPIKTANKLNIRIKLQTLGLEPIDVPPDGDCFTL